MNIDTNQVLEAAVEFFLPFSRWSLYRSRSLICAQKAQELGYHPEIILAGRRLNDSMGNM
jgi:UDP-N-acetyl-D-galactosamine dehydrogenase